MVSVIELSGQALSGSDTFDEGALAGDPLESYLGRDEQSAYALVAKRGSVTVERGGETDSYSSGRGYRTVTVVTDVRVVVAVGGAADGHDRVMSIPLARITDVDADSGLLRGTFVVETRDERWSIPCRGDLDPVVEYLRTVQRAWGLATEYVEDVDVYLDAARDHLEDDDPDTALSAIREADALVDQGEAELAERDAGETVATNAGLTRRRRTVRRLGRRANAQAADRARELALQRQDEGRYEDAMTAMERAREAYRRALETDAPRPPDADLDDRLTLLEWEMATLGRTPLANAMTAHARAETRETPLQRVAALSAARDRYQDLLGLCWGPNAAFAGDSSEIRERVRSVVLAIVDERIRLARRALTAADRFAVREATEPALSACAAADAHLDAARDVASELAPGRIDVIDAWADGVDEQRDRIRVSVETSDRMIGPPATHEPDDSEGEIDEGPSAGIALAGDTGEDDTSDAGAPEADAQSVAARLRSLEPAAFTEFVATLWRELGWQVTVRSGSSDGYDVMATRRDPVEITVLVWALHDPGRELDAAVVDRCVADRQQVDAGDVAALVTTGDLPPPVRVRAETSNVKLLDFEELCDLVDREALADRLGDN